MTGWRCHPEFALRWAALQEAIRLHSAPPDWVERVFLHDNPFTWCDLLTVTMEVLETLQCRVEEEGRFICRRDSMRRTRRFELGVDSDKVLKEWLMDCFCREGLRKCTRVTTSLHRPEEPGLAQ